VESPLVGFLHIARARGPVDPVQAEYRIVFAPLGGRLRSRHAQCRGLDALTDFLRQVRVPIPEIELVWRNLATRTSYSVPRVTLTRSQLDGLGL
jgi:hypothetical protein